MKISETVVLFSLLCASPVFAMSQDKPGGGEGRTKIDFKFDAVDGLDSRLFAKIDISAALAQLGNSGKPTNNDDLAGWTLTLTIGGSATFSAIADEKGKIKQSLSATPPVPFTAKLTAKGKILHLTANDLNLKALLGINPATGNGTVSVQIDVTASKTDANNVTTTVPLSAQLVTFNYKVKGEKVMGTNH